MDTINEKETKQEAYDKETKLFMAELEDICRKYQRVVTPRLHYTDTGIMPILSQMSTNPDYADISEMPAPNANIGKISLDDIIRPGEPL